MNTCFNKQVIYSSSDCRAFCIHPNVARLHLTKLSKINIISAVFVKSGKGGRPGREYKATEEGIELSFPKKEQSRLINWAMQLIEEIGPDALHTAQKISYSDGFEQMQKFVRSRKVLAFNEKLNSCSFDDWLYSSN